VADQHLEHLKKINPVSLKAGHEVKEANSIGIAVVGVACIILSIFMHIGLKQYLSSIRHHFERKQPVLVEPDFKSQRQAAPEPRLQSNPQADLKDYINRENELLTTYGWINRKSGVARIPIDRAMELLIEENKSGGAR
jgi:hypothetical protein